MPKITANLQRYIITCFFLFEIILSQRYVDYKWFSYLNANFEKKIKVKKNSTDHFSKLQIRSASAEDGWHQSFLEVTNACLRFLKLFWVNFTRPASMAASKLASGLIWGQKTLYFCSFYGHDGHGQKWSVLFFFTIIFFFKICM